MTSKTHSSSRKCRNTVLISKTREINGNLIESINSTALKTPLLSVWEFIKENKKNKVGEYDLQTPFKKIYFIM